jgi:acyl carrier protein
MDSLAAPQVHLDSEKLRRFIARYLGVDVKELTDEVHLCDDLGLDWLDQLELLVVIEDEFVGIDFFANTTAASLELVGDLIRQAECLCALTIRRSAA